MSLVAAFSTAVLPVLSIAVVGYLLGRIREVDVDPLGTVTLYVLTPALVFHSLATSSFGGRTAAGILASSAAFTVTMVLVAEGAARAIGETEPIRSGFVLASAFPNAGNYGIPLSAFAFGAVGRATAVLFIAGQALLMYTIGVYIASRGRGSPRDAVLEVFRVPLVYAVAAAGLARGLDVIPAADSVAMRTVGLVGDAAIPVMLLVLGIQLANTNAGATIRRVGGVTVLKLVVAPLVGLGVVLAIGFGDAAVARTVVLECGMPAAITPLIFAIEFDAPTEGDVSRPDYLSTAILVTTLASVPTLTVLITLLQAGVLV